MKYDEETVRWLRDEARDEGDRVWESLCNRALEGDADAREACAAAVRARVANAHAAHRKLGHSSECVTA